MRQTKEKEAEKKRMDIIQTKSVKAFEIAKKLGDIEKEHKRLRAIRNLSPRASTSISTCPASIISEVIQGDLKLQHLRSKLLAKKQSNCMILTLGRLSLLT